MGKRSRKQFEKEQIVEEIFKEEDPYRRQKKLLNHNFKLENIKPLTENQKKVFHAYGGGKHILLYGVAGTGKTFLAMYFGLSVPATPYFVIWCSRNR